MEPLRNEREFAFWVKRTHRTRGMERITIWALDSQQAVSRLPKCVSWNFAIA